MFDCARALQFTRSKAKEWNLDKTKVALAGGSAGACTSLWLAFHDDLADPQSADPISRESTRVTCAAVSGAQTTLDPHQMRAWTPNSKYGAHAFGISWDAKKKISSFDMFYAERERILPWIKQYSPYELVSRDDPPVGLFYSAAPNLGKDEKDPTHTANFGVKLKEHCDANQVRCAPRLPRRPEHRPRHRQRLRQGAPAPRTEVRLHLRSCSPSPPSPPNPRSRRNVRPPRRPAPPR
jgi:acetyl esterase/lipase